MQLIPSACQVPAHFLPYFLQILSLFNLHFDRHRGILGALMTSNSPSLTLPAAPWRSSHVLTQGWHRQYTLMVSGIFWFDFHYVGFLFLRHSEYIHSEQSAEGGKKKRERKSSRITANQPSWREHPGLSKVYHQRRAGSTAGSTELSAPLTRSAEAVGRAPAQKEGL